MSRRTNVRRITKAEVSAIADILAEVSGDVEELDHDEKLATVVGGDDDLSKMAEGYDDIEEVAKRILRAINLHRAEEENWVKVVKHGSGYLMYGPYRSSEAARSDESMMPGEVRLWSLVPPFGQGQE